MLTPWLLIWLTYDIGNTKWYNKQRSYGFVYHAGHYLNQWWFTITDVLWRHAFSQEKRVWRLHWLYCYHISKGPKRQWKWYMAATNQTPDTDTGLSCQVVNDHKHTCWKTSLITRFMGTTWGPRTQVSPMLAPWTLLSGIWSYRCATIINT